MAIEQSRRARFRDDASGSGRRLFRSSVAAQFGTGLAAAFLALVAAGMAAVAAAEGSDASFGPARFQLAALSFGIAALIGAFAVKLWRVAEGLGSRIVLDGPTLSLDLRRGRSTIARTPAWKADLPLTEVAAVETRIEVYPIGPMLMQQRSYRLRLKRQPSTLLFEERMLGTRTPDASLMPVAEEIASRARAPLRDLGVVRGRGGILGVWLARAPDWSTPDMGEAAYQAIARRQGLWIILFGLGFLALLAFLVTRP